MKLTDILKPGVLAVEYDRYSSVKQEYGMSLEIQRSYARQMVEHFKLDLIKIYSDEKTSGYHKPLEKRPGISALLADAEKNDFKVVLTLSIDRLSRNMFELLTIRETLDYYDIQLVYTIPGAVQPCEMDIVSEIIAYANAVYESEKISTRTRDVSKLRVEKGFWPGGNLPYGFYLNPQTRTIEVSQGAKSIVQEVHFRYQSGESFNKIATTLDQSLAPGGQWTRWVVENIIKNPIYTGKITWNKRKSYSNSAWRNPDEWIIIQSKYVPRIIDDDMYALSQEVLYHKQITLANNKRYYSSSYVLKGLLSCYCGELLLTKNQQTKNLLKNGTTKSYGREIYYCPCKCIKINKTDIEDLIKTDIIDLIKNQDISECFTSKLNHDVKRIADNLVEIEERIKLLKEKDNDLSTQITAINNDKHLAKAEKDSAIICFQELKQYNNQEISLLEQKMEFLRRSTECKKNILNRKDFYIEKVFNKLPTIINDLSYEHLKTILKYFYKSIRITSNNEVIVDYAVPGSNSKFLYLPRS